MFGEERLDPKAARREVLIDALRTLISHRPFIQTTDEHDPLWVTKGAAIPDGIAQQLRKAGFAMIADGRLCATLKAGITLKKIDEARRKKGVEQMRSVVINGRQWYVLSDACLMLRLGVKAEQFKAHLKLLDKDEIRVVRLNRFQEGKTTLISESGMYKLLMRSNKPAARRIQDMLARKIIPRLVAHHNSRRFTTVQQIGHA